VTDVAHFAHCRHRHFWSVLQGINRSAAGRIFAPPSAAELGVAFHSYVQHRISDWTPEHQLARAKAALARVWFSTSEEMLHDGALRILTYADRLDRSVWGRQMSLAGTRVRRELPFHWRLNGNTVIHGSIDALYERHGGLTIVDYKTGTLGEEYGLAMAKVAAHHEVQAASYALAMEGLEHRPVRRVVFYFAQTGTSYALRVTPSWLTSWRGKLDRLTGGMAEYRRDHAQRAPEIMRYDAMRCDDCPLRRICRPQGDPLVACAISAAGAGQVLP
jgi:CRISPR/Cas system-associated exonuclease Cas4 (RecB family)